jgi:hypothetical protein
MQTSHHRRREMFLRLKDFAATHTDISTVPAWPPLVTGINTVCNDLEGHVAAEAAHGGAALQGTDIRGSARSALREGMERLVRTARGIAEQHPGFNAQFRTPIGNNDQDSIDAALGMVTAAKPADVKAKFISYGMPADFIEDLQEDIAEFQAAITEQSGKVGDRQILRRNDRQNRRRRHEHQAPNGPHSPQPLPRPARCSGRMGNRESCRAGAEAKESERTSRTAEER